MVRPLPMISSIRTGSNKAEDQKWGYIAAGSREDSRIELKISAERGNAYAAGILLSRGV